MLLNKVEICGVDTSKLPVLTNAQMLELFKRIHAGDTIAREEFIRGNLRLVLSVIQRFHNRGEHVDDLFQVGCIGLIKAIDNFDTKHNVRFSTYAVPMIIGEIRRYLRDNNAIRVSRSLRDIAYKALQARTKLMNANTREPTIDEIAKELEMKPEEIVFALDAILVMDQISDENSNDDSWLDGIALQEGMRRLNDREKKILRMRFFDGRTQMEVATEIGISYSERIYDYERRACGHRGAWSFRYEVSLSLSS